MTRVEMPVLWSPAHELHEPGGEIWVGIRTPGTELPERAARILAALEKAGAPIAEAGEDRATELELIHRPELLAYLESAWAEWQAAGLDADPGQDRVVPYLFPHPGLLGAVEPLTPGSAPARAGQFTYDTMTLIGPGTWTAARAAIDCALAAAERVRGGERAAYALCRPPGHHATPSAFGGSCYLNNAAAAAARLRAQWETVAVVDIDAHHGNGTQAIFYDDPRVVTGSVHVDPREGWFPHFLGGPGEEGSGAGEGANRNLPVAPGSGDDEWLPLVRALTEWAGARAGALVVGLGVDAAKADPESPLDVTREGYAEAGRILGELGLPTVFVQEGGYDLETIGDLVVATLAGFESA